MEGIVKSSRKIDPEYDKKGEESEALHDMKGILGQEEKEKQSASEQISLQHIMELREAFDAAKKHKDGALELEEFMDAFGGIIGKDMNDKQINQLFMKIDADSNGSVDWNEFMNYMLLENETLSSMKAEHFEYVKSNAEDPAPNKTKLCHSDMITCILVLTPEDEDKKKLSVGEEEELKEEQKEEQKSYFSKKNVKYITSSRDGKIKIWNGNTQECHLTINVGRYWVNCIQYMTKSKRLVAACSDRTLKFYDLSLTNINLPVSEIADFDGLPLCMDYFLKPKLGVETLIVGDDMGICYMYDFSKEWHSCEWRIDDPTHYCCHKDEIKKRFEPSDSEDSEEKKKKDSKADKKKIDKKAKKDKNKDENGNKDPLGSKNKKLTKLRINFEFMSVQIHQGCITKIKYIEDLNSLLSSSSGGFLHFHEVENLNYKDRSFSLHQKGVSSFVYSERHRFVASCGEERHIIMWDPFTRRAITYLNGHNTSVHDLTINDDRHHLISLGTDKVVKIWDIRTYKCIQTIFDKICYRPEDRLTCIFFDKISNNILLGSRKINSWFFKTQEEIKTSHEYPVSKALYNTEFESVVSCDDGSFISVWDIENGKLMSKFGNAHGKNTKITSACFDESQRRLVTSAADGSIKVWNFSNGQEISTCIPTKPEAKESEVTDLCFVSNTNNKQEFGNILAVGWNKHVYIYPDNKEDEIFQSNILPQSDQGVKHHDDIMSVVYSRKDNLVFTGSHEGRIIGWNFETKRAKFELHLEDDTCVSDSPALDAKSVDCMLVLETEGILLTGTADQYIRFWDTKNGKLLNKVSAKFHPEEALTAIASCSVDETLFCGDTSGCIKKFDLKIFDFKNSRELDVLWFIKAHRAIINSIAVAELKECENKFIISCSDDRNIHLHSFDGFFIGQFGQEEEWNIYKADELAQKFTRKNAKIKPYGTYAKNMRLEMFLKGELDSSEIRDYQDEIKAEEDEYPTKGYTVENASRLLGYKPKKVKNANSDKYFYSITKHKPDLDITEKNKGKFFKKMVGNNQDHYKDLIKQIKQ